MGQADRRGRHYSEVSVSPAYAGVHCSAVWMPAFAGMTVNLAANRIAVYY
jgi:hypothetical protein